ncbi:MAG: hypothetical protein IPN38_19900 [Flavobacteriales bacterium]|nr:hypothetical protein [Flavobacteriales bacterium]
MSKHESIEWVTVQDIVLGTNPRTTKPGKERINEYARSIALYGILVPLIAEKEGRCLPPQAYLHPPGRTGRPEGGQSPCWPWPSNNVDSGACACAHLPGR